MTNPNNNLNVANPSPPAGQAQTGGPNAATVPGSSPLNTGQVGPGPILNGAIANPGVNINNVGIGLGSGQLTPPPLKTFVYSPEVRVIIGTSTLQYDVSADIARCTLIRQENSAATFTFTLHNKNLRYTPPGQTPPPFDRMDRVVVYMKKTAWAQVFSGYIDTIPYKQLYPGEVTYKCTCTLKRLMHTWWNPSLPASAAFLDNINSATFFGDGQLGGSSNGMASLLQQLLVQVGGWNIADIHIQNFPLAFLTFMQAQITAFQQSNAPNIQALNTLLTGTSSPAAPGAAAGANPNAGPPGSTIGVTGPIAGLSSTDTTTAFYITQIVAACDQKGLGPQTSTNNLGAALEQSGATGESGNNPFGSPNQQQAWQQVQQAGQNIQTTARNSDGAILGVAVAMVETGAGTTIRNLYNQAVPGSSGFPNDGPGTNGTACGIMGEQNGWGNLSQRMNPQQAAGMFMAALQGVSGWRDMDAGQACQQAIGSVNSVAYDAAIPLATTLVQAYRTGTSGTASTVIPSAYAGPNGSTVPAAASAIGASAAGGGGAPSVLAGAVPGVATNVNAGTSLTNQVNPLNSYQPQPNSEGAINFARTCLGLPYVWGGKGPSNYDCSGLVSAAFASIGVQVPSQTDAIRNQVPQIPNNAVQRGDLVEPETGHVVLYTGPTIIEAQQTGVPIHEVPAATIGAPNTWAWVGRACQNGGPNPSAPFNPPATMGPGNPPGALTQLGGPLSSGSQGGSDGVALNLFSMMFTPGQFASATAGMLHGEKAFVDGQPLLQMVAAIAAAGLRNWSSGPDGSFIAWYPDYWGLDGKPCVWQLNDIELTDVHIDFTDDALTTHVYVDGDWSMLGQQASIEGWLDTAGVVTVEDDWLYKRLTLTAPSGLGIVSGQQLMQRFGIRPMTMTAAMAGTHELEFLMACQLFMQKWAEQYQTTVTMTYMPELLPGMRVDLGGHNLQVYISGVTHFCDYAHGFTTSCVIMAPATPHAKQLMLSANAAEIPFATPYGPSDAQFAFTAPGFTGPATLGAHLGGNAGVSAP